MSQLIFTLISPGGGIVTAGLAIYDTMQFINAPINYCNWTSGKYGKFPSTMAGEPRKRFVLGSNSFVQ